MKMNTLKRSIILCCLLAGGTLFSCSQEGDSGPKGSPVYQVDYFDETGNQVGYAYAIEGKSGPFKAMDGTSYDWNPHSDLEITTPGSRFVFDKWVGTYDAGYGKVAEGYDGEDVDLNSIHGDCKVRAVFKEKPYTIGIAFKNDGKTYDAGSKVNFGEPLSFPNTNPSEEKPEYYFDYNFAGWTLLKDTSSAKHKFIAGEEPSYVYKSGANAGASAWGLGAPQESDATNNPGVIYLDKTLTEHMPTYDAYISDGAKWIELGKLSSGSLTLEFESEYTKSYKQFIISVCAQNDPSSEEMSFPATYGDEITFERTTTPTKTTLTVCYGGEAKHVYEISTSSQISYLLEGTYQKKDTYENVNSDFINGTKMSFTIEKNPDGVPVGGKAKIQGNARIYPIVSELH